MTKAYIKPQAISFDLPAIKKASTYMPTVPATLIPDASRHPAKPRRVSGRMIATTHGGDVKRNGYIRAVFKTKGQPPKTIHSPCRTLSFSVISLLTIDSPPASSSGHTRSPAPSAHPRHAPPASRQTRAPSRRKPGSPSPPAPPPPPTCAPAR